MAARCANVAASGREREASLENARRLDVHLWANLRMRLMFDPLARGLGRYIASE
jgi:hypothetical protein